MWLGGKLSDLGRQLIARSAREALQNDSRPPILLLRSFQDDKLAVELESSKERFQHLEKPATNQFLVQNPSFAPIFYLFGMGRTILQTRGRLGGFTFEESLTDVLSRFGPVVAIGRPGEQLPPTGAARDYLGNDEWKARVDELMAQSQLIVMIIGDAKGADGLAWEINRLFSCKEPEKIVLIFPPLQDEEELYRRWKVFRAIQPGLPKFKEMMLSIGFGPSWKPLVHCGHIEANRFSRDYQAAIWKLVNASRNHRLDRHGADATLMPKSPPSEILRRLLRGGLGSFIGAFAAIAMLAFCEFVSQSHLGLWTIVIKYWAFPAVVGLICFVVGLCTESSLPS